MKNLLSILSVVFMGVVAVSCDEPGTRRVDIRKVIACPEDYAGQILVSDASIAPLMMKIELVELDLLRVGATSTWTVHL